MISEKDRKRIADEFGEIQQIYSEEQKETVGFCSQGYAFVNVVEDTNAYRAYRCDGGSHVGIMLKKPPHEKHSPKSIVLNRDGTVSMSGSADVPTDVPIW